MKLALVVPVILSLIAAAACGTPRDSFDLSGRDEFGRVDGGLPDAGESTCASKEVKAEPLPLAMLVLIDRSGSMKGDKWDAATTAIRTFADRAEVVGMKMGVQFFPSVGSSEMCDASAYIELAVPIAPLPDNVLPIQQKLLATTASGATTPLRSSLEGSIAAMQQFIEGSTPHAGAVILVTDGNPTHCGTIAEVASVAERGAIPPADVPRVRTFAVGMEGASFGNLDQIAEKGGGAPKAFDVGSGPAAQQALIEALESIRRDRLGCEYVLPIPLADEGELDLHSVEVKFTPGKNDPSQTIRRVDGASACAEAGGYYYDDPARPERVLLCPASCKTVQGGALEAKLEFRLGCIKKPN